ncbi:MAG: nucleotide exchange factor GrpE [Eubacteriales bacterium]|nr:nucleotide exchange factor GrpE [Eubacteriales bacterium]
MAMTTDDKENIKIESDEAEETGAESGQAEAEAGAKADATVDSDQTGSDQAGPGEADAAEAADDSIASEPEPEDDEEAEKKSAEEEAWNDKYTRLMADFQNYKRRTEKEKADVYAFANEKLVGELLQVLDNFERAIDNECQDKAYADGMKMIFKQFSDILAKSGLKEIEAKGQDFDPNFHHAVLQDDNDEFESGQVTEVLQKGYTLNEKVIRPAMVKVNK